MFSFRRKPKKVPDTPSIRTSPSLPELNSQGILHWPEDLVDLAAIRQNHQSDVVRPQSATKISFQRDQGPISFHKPFRPSIEKANDATRKPTVPKNPSLAYDTTVRPLSAARFSQRRARIPPTFNLMVVGGKGTGKTSLLRLLLETADISPGATGEQKGAVDRFLKGSTKATHAIQTACVEICESRFDRVLFSVIDTPGLDFQEGRELKLERQVTGIIKYVDAQYADTMTEESKVVRQSKGDQHIHLCIYMIDTASIMTDESRRVLSTVPSKTRSESTVSVPPDLVPDTSSGDEDSDDEESNTALTMSPAEIRVIRRLSTRTNVLPVIARADSLTDEKLLAVKNAIRTGLAEAGLDFGVFGPTKKAGEQQKRQISTHQQEMNGNGYGHANGILEAPEEEEEEEEEEDASSNEDGDERKSRPVIKLRPTRHGARGLSSSRSRRDLSQVADTIREPVSPDDSESVANIRFSARIVAKTDLTALMPFALIAPEPNKRRPRCVSTDSGLETPRQQSEDDHVLKTPISVHSSRNPILLPGPPQDLKGVFIRKFRWGTVDVLDPNHCDFAALRTTVLSTHLKLLKIHTKEVLYENYRTEKLLARRATRQISEEERQRLFEDLGL